MPNTSLPESAYLPARDLLEKRYIRGLRSVLLMLLLGLPLVLGLSVVQHSAGAQIAIVAVALVLTGLAYWLLHRGHYPLASQLVVFSLIACSVAGILAYGSVRNALVLGFAGAVVTAGMTLGKRTLILSVALSAAALAALTWAEASGLLVKPDFGVGLRFWLILVLLLTGIAVSVYTSRQVVLQALREQHTELKRREQAEYELLLSETRFSRIFRSSPAAIVVQAMNDMTVLDVNPAFERLYGYSRGEFIGSTDAALWDDPKARKAFLRQMEATDRVINLPLDGRRKDGQLINVLLSSEIEGRGPERIVVSTITDATAETQARQAARQSAELFSKAFDFSPINMTITRVSDGKFLAVNSAEDLVQGFTASELIGRTSVDAGVWRDEEERKKFMEELRAQGQVQSHDRQMRHKDGTLIDCRMWAVIVEIAGEPCVLSSTINITEQKRREALLIDVARSLSTETGEAFFRSVVQHVAKAMEADLVMVGETADDQSVTSLAMVQDGLLQPNIRYELAGTPCDMVIGHSDLCVYGDGVQQLFPQDGFLVDGGYRAYAGVALRDADGTPIGIVNALWRKPQPLSPDRDALLQIFASRITAELMRLRRDREIARLNETLEQRVSERTDQLRATNAELESFGYSVSHDLQSPLRSIEGFSVLLARRLRGRLSHEEQRLFDRVKANVVRMHELINDLLALARVSKGKLLLEQVNLSALAQQVIAQERQREPQRQVRVTVQPGISAHCDSKFARIILENLIGNAWKYSRAQADAQIEFGALPTREGGRKMLFVRDNGAGFNMAYSASLFKPFHRLHHEHEFEGSGIGLATVHRILERHGGVIRAESTEGAGACFYFSFDPRFGPGAG
ncbi:PAS domain-containing sensor histidine kinase [Polaromonas sp. JS666]|uniref:PAS domain-containing sensor histidine kinase n=2 Tax=unclassified Polaromonas TaxID=2638319 RepID=UPI000046462D|nr:PAS domain S-box protein [Polaromonas sp. JS666]ABE43677.1 multi-sensor signal transduction histidine kinase [Polaromonas sp. JS666]